MKKTCQTTTTNNNTKAYGLTPVGLQEYRAYIEEIGMHFSFRGTAFKEEAIRWAKAAEAAYARDPEEFVLSGIANGRTRDEDIQRVLKDFDDPGDEPDEDDYIELPYWR